MKLHGTGTKNEIINITFDDRKDIFSFGEGNELINLIDLRFLLSPTASLCLSKSSKAIYGKGFNLNLIVNDEGQTLNQVLKIASKEFEKYGNTFIHVGYNADLNVKSIKVIPFSYIRVGKADDEGYSGKFIKYDWSKDKINTKDYIKIDKFNTKKNVIESQINEAGGIKNYKGQVIHLQRDYGLVYSIPKIYSAIKDAELEHNSSVFRSNGGENGFLGAKIMITPKLDDSGRRDLKQTLNGLKGSHNSNGVFIMELDNITDNIKEKFSLEDLSNGYNDKLFEYSDKQSEKNISKAMTVPIQLVKTDDNSLFSGGSEILKQASDHLWEQREEERQLFEETFNILLQRFEGQEVTEFLEIQK